jgi:Protein of unknown function (DUF3617)
MKSSTRLAICVAAGLATLGVVAIVAQVLQSGRGGERLKPGQWSVATAVGGSAFGEPTSRCISAEDALAANGEVDDIAEAARQEGAAQSCSVREVHIAGPTITIEMLCQGLPARSTMTYGGTRYEGTLATAIGRPAARTVQIKGWRIGECS